MVSGRALSLLIKRGNSNTVMDSTPRPEEVGVTRDVDQSEEAAEITRSAREKKRSRNDKEMHSSKKHSLTSPPTGGLAPGNVLTVGSTSRDMEALGERAGSIMIEIGPEARWNVGDQQPIQAFGAFRLARDASSYEGFSRAEVVLRSKRRLGMFISDYERALDGVEGEIKDACGRETAALRKELSESNRKLSDMRSRGEEAVRMLEVEAKARSEEKESLNQQIANLEGELSRCRLNGDEFKKERDKAMSHNIALSAEVTALKKSLAEGDEELVQSLASGYNACLDRLVEAGVDCSGHSFEDYCGTLKAEETGNTNKEQS